MNVPLEDFAGVKSNLVITDVLRETGKDAAYFNGSVLDHACPMTIRKVNTPKNMRRSKRIPLNIMGNHCN